jgi:mono/diheme cytochrome c family protein
MRLKTIVLAAAGLVVLLVPVGISLTIGWRPIIGPRLRPLTDRKFEVTAARLERGKYLVDAVATCFGCHSEPDKNDPGFLPKAGREGAGQTAGVDPVLGEINIPNITPDKETGIGNWTDDEIARAIREGVDRDGRTLFPLMPYDNLKHMSDEDVASVVVYLRSIPPIRNSVPRMRPPFVLGRLVMNVPEPVTQPVPPPEATPVARGAYLVALAHCVGCHTPFDPNNGQFREDLLFAGGTVFDSVEGKKRASLNITPDPSGISYFDENIFMTIIRNGKYGARELHDPMPWVFYRNMTDEDLKAVWAYVHNLKPVFHHIDNSMEPTMCPICGNVHGAGDTNKKKASD